MCGDSVTPLLSPSVGNHLQQCGPHADNNSIFIMLHLLDNTIYHTVPHSTTKVQNQYHTVRYEYHTVQYDTSWSQWHRSERWLSVNLAFCWCHSCQWLSHIANATHHTATQNNCHTAHYHTSHCHSCHKAQVPPIGNQDMSPSLLELRN